MKRFIALSGLLILSVISGLSARAGTTIVYGSPFVINGTTNMLGGAVGQVAIPQFTLQVVLPYGIGATNQAAYSVYASFNTNLNVSTSAVTNGTLLGTFYPSSTSPGTYNFVQSSVTNVQIYIGIATSALTTNYVNIVQ